jgi:hypothetical protein
MQSNGHFSGLTLADGFLETTLIFRHGPMSAPFDFGDGRVEYDGWEIAEDIPLENQIDVLNEDLIQVRYGDRVTLDIGWHGGLRKFLLYLVKDADWDNPVYRGEFNTVRELIEAVRNMVPKATELSKG